MEFTLAKHLNLRYGLQLQKTPDSQILNSLPENTSLSVMESTPRKHLTFRYGIHSKKTLDSQISNSLSEDT